jgi:hypothetical protein
VLRKQLGIKTNHPPRKRYQRQFELVPPNPRLGNAEPLRSLNDGEGGLGFDVVVHRALRP